MIEPDQVFSKSKHVVSRKIADELIEHYLALESEVRLA